MFFLTHLDTSEGASSQLQAVGGVIEDPKGRGIMLEHPLTAASVLSSIHVLTQHELDSIEATQEKCGLPSLGAVELEQFSCSIRCSKEPLHLFSSIISDPEKKRDLKLVTPRSPAF